MEYFVIKSSEKLRLLFSSHALSNYNLHVIFRFLFSVCLCDLLPVEWDMLTVRPTHHLLPCQWSSCRINLWTFCHTPWICNFINWFDSDLSDTDNIVPFENISPINLINLLCVLLFWHFHFGGVSSDSVLVVSFCR